MHLLHLVDLSNYFDRCQTTPEQLNTHEFEQKCIRP